jgi:glucose/mannose transport system substrate-binding protein
MVLLAASAICGAANSAPAAAAAPVASLRALHWWTSNSERRAADVLVKRLADEHIVWQDAAIPGGAGVGAGNALRSRVLAGDAPEVMQLIGKSIKEWGDLGLLLELDKVAEAEHWDAVLFPTINKLVQHRGHVIAVPLGIHRVNTLFYNRQLFARFKLAPPTTWREFQLVAAKLQAAGVQVLAQSSEPWQVAGLFETLVLAEGGPEYYRALFVGQTQAAVADKRLLSALERLRVMKGWIARPLRERSWTEVSRQLSNGEAAMMVMGDWVKGELNSWGFRTDQEFGCVGVPGTASYHLYSVDTLAMFTSHYAHMATQEKLASITLHPLVQQDYNRAKGSVSVRRDADPARMDSCARQSWTIFAKGSAVQAPSLTHRMAADEESRNAIIAEIHQFFMDETVSAAETQRRLGRVLRGFQLRNNK